MTATDFTAFKNNRKNSIQKLNEEVKKVNAYQQTEDNRFWELKVDNAGNGSAIIRFLPEVKGEDVPFVRIWSHGFKGINGWYIERSLTTIGKDDPVTEYNNKLWETGDKEKRDLVSGTPGKQGYKRNLHFTSNILVIKDPANPANNGKVFLYNFGKKIFDMLNGLMNPVENGIDEVKPINPFDFWEGCNFRLRAKKKDGFRNYEGSTFDPPGVISDADGKPFSDEQIEAIWNSEYSLQAFLDPKEFKTYEELKARHAKVLGLDGTSPVKNRDEESTSPPWEDDEPKQKEVKPKEQKSSEAAPIKSSAPISSTSTEDEEGLDWLTSLVDKE
jgi:hypothetical protein